MAKAGVGSKNNSKILHPQILINQLGKVNLPGLKDLPMSENKPILHQAVQLKQTEIPKGNLTLSKLLYMGFDVNALDDNSETAISYFFKTSLQSRGLLETYDLFLNPGSQKFDVDLLMKDLCKNFSLFGKKGFGPCFLLKIVKHIGRVPRSDWTNFLNLCNFIKKIPNYRSSECRRSNGCLTCSSIGERMIEFLADIKQGDDEI